MKIEHFDEPLLEFSDGRHVCPRKGIMTYGVFDRYFSSRSTVVNVGAVGSGVCLQKLSDWIDRCRERIDAPKEARQPRLFQPFPGIGLDSSFYTTFHHSRDLCRQVPQGDIKDVLGIERVADRIARSVDLFHQHITFLVQNREVDVIICVIPDQLYDALTSSQDAVVDDVLDDGDASDGQQFEELNFRRALKARALHLSCPLQLIRESTFDPATPEQQDEATKAWNFWTAIYYKSGPKVPWKVPRYDGSLLTSCAIGIAFYRSRDQNELRTSLAQVFDEMGNGLILRGTPVEIDKHDRTPRLSHKQAHELVFRALEQYHIALRTFPARVVVHKSANFGQDELDGITSAATECGVQMLDFITLLNSKVHLYRQGNYPPYRGTALHLDDDHHILYTRGSVWYYQTYPGLYVPQPIEYRMVQCDSSPVALGKEILALTKLNWNNTQLDGKYPITLGCARKVGEILKYLGPDEVPPIRYAYYM